MQPEPAPWGLVTYRRADGGADRAGIRTAGGVILSHPLLDGAVGLMDLVQRWQEIEGDLRQLDVDDGEPVPGARLLAPLRYPRKLLGAGANYTSHAAEMGGRAPSGVGEPWFYSVPPSTTIIGDGEEVRIPADPAAQVDWEAELAVVLARSLHHATREQATAAVLGYTILNDISARGLSRRPDAPAVALQFDWLNHKGRDTFAPMGPAIIPHWLLDTRALSIRLWVNGVLKQDGSTRDMIVDPPGLLSALSRSVTLEPGDVLATGTPAGVGATRGEFLRPGDDVAIEIDDIGRLVNPIRAE